MTPTLLRLGLGIKHFIFCIIFVLMLSDNILPSYSCMIPVHKNISTVKRHQKERNKNLKKI